MSNALRDATSPYLVQHAGNPVDWMPWGEQAFARARERGVPVFLSVGYSTCHWCHVMARESFEDPGIADLLNRHFVSVKVDREERPDVDRLYMGYVQATTGSGGWPMSVWLTPEGAPFYGGTYFPPDDRHGRVGFPRLLLAIAHAWREQREELCERGAEGLRVLAETGEEGREPAAAADAMARQAVAHFLAHFDAQHGGFGAAPKFPRPCVLALLFREGGKAEALATLEAMALGGMHDALGGGFHRYSVDRFWHVPHFEKMLYDQAQLAVSCTEAWQLTGRSFFREVAESTLAYILRDLGAEEGGLYSAEDADSPLPGDASAHAEGAFYVWDRREIESLLTENEAKVLCAHYGVRAEGNIPAGSDPHGELTGRNVLHAAAPIESSVRLPGLGACEVAMLLASARTKLFRARLARPRPHLDDKIVTAWNGLAISALARAAVAFGNEAYAEAARRCADFLHRHLWAGQALRRSWRCAPSVVGGFAEDHAFLAAGLLDLYEARGDARHLGWALRLQEQLDARFWDPVNGGYFTDCGDDPLLKVRVKGDHDGAEPLADSVAADTLRRLRTMGLPTLRGPEDIFKAWSSKAARYPAAFPALLVACAAAARPARQAVFAGEPAAALPLLERLRRSFSPDLVVLYAGSMRDIPALRRPELEAMQPGLHGTALHLCENFTCRAPIFEPSGLDSA